MQSRSEFFHNRIKMHCKIRVQSYVIKLRNQEPASQTSTSGTTTALLHTFHIRFKLLHIFIADKTYNSWLHGTAFMIWSKASHPSWKRLWSKARHCPRFPPCVCYGSNRSKETSCFSNTGKTLRPKLYEFQDNFLLWVWSLRKAWNLKAIYCSLEAFEAFGNACADFCAWTL